jgi:hypothetical protein
MCVPPVNFSRALDASDRERPSSASSSPERKADLMDASDAMIWILAGWIWVEGRGKEAFLHLNETHLILTSPRPFAPCGDTVFCLDW